MKRFQKTLSKNNFEWSLKKLSLILQPFVPHISEEIWYNIEGNSLCINEVWPIENVKKDLNLKIAVQINGKTREIVEIDKNTEKHEVIQIVKDNEKIKKSIMGKKIVREIYVPGKIVNLVI